VLRVARREVVAMLRDGRFRLASILMMVVLAVSAYSGWRGSLQEAELRERTMHSFREEWEGQQEKNPHSAGHFGTYVLKPAPSLAGIEPGLDPYIGRLIFLEAHIRNDFVHRPAVESTPLRHFGFFTASFVLQVAAPLLIVLFGYGAFAGERESGTLRQSLAAGAPVGRVVGGKILGVLAGLMLLLTPAAVLGAFAIGLARGTLEIDRIALLSGGYLLYFVSFVGIVLFVSALARRSQVALVVLLGFWALTIFVVPRVASDVASNASPLPSRATIDDEVRRLSLEGIDGHDPQDKRRDELLERVLAQYGVGSAEELPVNFDAIAMQASEDYTTEVYRQKFEEVASVLHRQRQAISAASALSPYIAIRDWSMASVGTDLRHHLAFAKAVEDYRIHVNRELNKDMEINSRTGDYGYYVDQEFWQTIPAFAYERPSSLWSVSGATSSLFALSLWALGALMLAGFGAARIRP
jgi:ABC-2 type transport system permease protein